MGEESSTDKSRIHQAISLISSLISLSHSIRVFPSKWNSISRNLENLFTSLTTIQSSEPSKNFSLSIAVESILTTLNYCSELANQCLEISYSGKLLMQSDLEIVSTKLDQHLKNLNDIYSMGLVTQKYAMVVSKPKASSSKDDLRFYLNDLLSRFKIGSNCMKREAIVAFNECVIEDERYLKIGVEIEGFVYLLVNFLDVIEIQEEAVKAVCFFAGFDRNVLIRAGAISSLIRVLECGSESSKEFSARCLMKVTENSENAWAVSGNGGVTALLKICGDYCGTGGVLVSLCCGVLKNLVGVEEIKRFMVDEGSIPLFIRLLRSKDEAVQIGSIELLQTMGYGDESIKVIIVEEGGIRVLVRILDPKCTCSIKAREVAYKGIFNLCLSSEICLNSLMNSRFMDHTLYFLRFGDSNVVEMALKASFWLSETSDDAKKAMGEVGFIPILVKFLESKSLEIREMAAEILSSMVIVPKNRKRFVQSDQNVGILLRMLDPGEVDSSGSKKILLSILMSLTSSNSGRKKISSSGYLKNVEKLAEGEFSDAKKIVKKLSSGRFLSVLSGLLRRSS